MNIAGISTWGTIERLDHSHWQKMIDVNLMGPISVLECFVPPMIEAGRGGHVVNVSSAAGLFGLPWHAAYSASKFGLRGVSEVLRFDLRRHGIGVSLVCPGAVRTPLVGTVEIVGVDRDDPRIRKLIARFERHAVSPEQVAEKILEGIEKEPLHGLHLARHPLGYWFQRKFAPAVRAGDAAAQRPPGRGRRAPLRGREPRRSRFGRRRRGSAKSSHARTPSTSRTWSSATRPGSRRCAASRSRSQPGEFFGLLGPERRRQVDADPLHDRASRSRPAGSIEVFGHDAIDDYGEARQAVGLAPQEPNLDWFLTVEETLDYHAGYFGMPKRERRERTKELLETFSLTEKRDERTRTLSGGMKRRLILARAMMHRPRLLILDEPTAGVDVELRLELWHYVQRINQEGTTILLTTHYLEEAEQLCDRIAFINDGRDRRRGDERRSSPSATASPTSRTPTWRWSAARSSRARTSRSSEVEA